MGAAVDRLIVLLAGPADEARDGHGRWTAGGASDPSAHVSKGLQAFENSDGLIEHPPTSVAASYLSQIDDMTSMLDPVDAKTFLNDEGVKFTKNAINDALEQPDDTHLWVAQVEGMGVGGAISAIDYPEGALEQDAPSYVYVSYLGSTGLASGAGTALTVEVAKHAAEKNWPVMGEPASPSALVFWKKMGWHEDPLEIGSSLWGWTADEAKAVARGH